MARRSLHLRAGETLTITADGFSSGTYHRVNDSAGGEPYSPVSVAASSSTTVGPFTTDRVYCLDSASGELTYAISIEDPAHLTDVVIEGAQLKNTIEIDSMEALPANLTTVGADRSLVVAADTQAVVFGPFTVAGTLRIDGKLHAAPLPV